MKELMKSNTNTGQYKTHSYWPAVESYVIILEKLAALKKKV